MPSIIRNNQIVFIVPGRKPELISFKNITKLSLARDANSSDYVGQIHVGDDYWVGLAVGAQFTVKDQLEDLSRLIKEATEKELQVEDGGMVEL